MTRCEEPHGRRRLHPVQSPVSAVRQPGDPAAGTSAVNQHDFMEAYAGAEPELYRTGVGLFTPGTPMATDVGVEAIKGRTDFDKIKQELAAAGYKGEKIVLLAPTTIPSLNAKSQVAGDLLRRMGFNVDYQALEWGMVVARRASKEPPEKGGWHISITNLTSFNNVFVPAQIAIRSGPDAWFGWRNAPKLEECAQRGWTRTPRRTRSASCATCSFTRGRTCRMCPWD